MADQSDPDTEISRLIATEVYSQRDNPAFSDTMAIRTASDEIPFFLAHVRPGMAVIVHSTWCNCPAC